MFEKFWLNYEKPAGWSKEFSSTNSLFIHVPKTAGTSISRCCYVVDPWHYPIEYYSYLFENLKSKLFKFAFVRSPYSRILLAYRYSFSYIKNYPNTSIKFVTDFDSFSKFVEGGLVKRTFQNIISFHFKEIISTKMAKLALILLANLKI